MQPGILENVTVTDKLLLTSQEQWGSRVPAQVVHCLPARAGVPSTSPSSGPILATKGRKWNFPLQTSQQAKAQVHQRGFCFLRWCVCLMRATLAFIFLFFFFAPRSSRDARRYLFPLRKQEVNGNYFQGNVKHSGCYFSASMCVMKLKLSLWNPQRHIRLEGGEKALLASVCASLRESETAQGESRGKYILNMNVINWKNIIQAPCNPECSKKRVL